MDFSFVRGCSRTDQTVAEQSVPKQFLLLKKAIPERTIFHSGTVFLNSKNCSGTNIKLTKKLFRNGLFFSRSAIVLPFRNGFWDGVLEWFCCSATVFLFSNGLG